MTSSPAGASSASRSPRPSRPRSAAPKRRRAAPLKPFTIDHFRAWSRVLVLDTGDHFDPEDWQLEVARDHFDGYPEVWQIVPEGNGKTTFLAVLALYHGDYTPAASAMILAAAREQAGVLFRQAGGFVERTPSLAPRFEVFHGYRHIRCLRLGGLIEVKAADPRTADGIIPSLLLIDELHNHRDMQLYRRVAGKLLKRGGQLVTISTAGEPGAEFEQTRRQLLATADDVTVDGFHTRAAAARTVIHDWSVPEDADVSDMAVVKAANPLTSLTVDDLAAKHASSTMTDGHWRRFVCNQAMRGEHSAVGTIEWANARTDERIPEGQSVYCGLDIGWKWDTTAVWPIWVPSVDCRLLGLPEIITPPRDGTSLEPARIHSALRTVHDRNPIEVLVIDGAVGGEVIADWAQRELGCRVVVHSNGHAAQCLAFERWMEGLREGWLRHPGHDEATTHVLNARARILQDGRSRFDRPVSTRSAADLQDQRVIDALSAASGAHSVAVGDLRAGPARKLNVADYRITSL